jgi:uncharacterized protein YabN with tetrapyrrole methylase and pyrophosphatase domain
MSATFSELQEIMRRLRGPDGCAWDREQDLDSFLPNLRGELEELEAAAAGPDLENLKEEIGDLLFNLVFLAQIATDEGWFTMEEVMVGIRDKIVRRHPHVFGDATADTPEAVVEQWERIKKEEKS